MRRYRLLKVLKVGFTVVAGIALFGFVVQRLWNWLIPEVFGWKSITFAQALGLLVLSKILFGGFHRRGGSRGRHWKHRLGQHWASMSPEERERFRAGLRGRMACRWDRTDQPTPEQAAQ